MGRISKKKLNSEVEEKIFETFWETIASLKNSSDVEQFIKSLLSYTEQLTLAKRLAIALLVQRGYNYEYISGTLNVSTSTILAVDRQIKLNAQGYKIASKKAGSKRLRDKTADALASFLLSISKPARYGSAKYRLKKEMGAKIAKRQRKRSVL